MKRQGFTLIELLVVIAIIAILAAILFPVFARAKAKARQTTCLSNVKQIALSVKMYMSDWEDSYPRNEITVVNDTHPIEGGVFLYHQTKWFWDTWYGPPWRYDLISPGGLMTPYVMNLDILVCPDWQVDITAGALSFQSYGNNANLGYYHDTGGCPQNWSGPYWLPVTEGTIHDSAGTVMFGDFTCANLIDGTMRPPCWVPCTGGTPVAYRHNVTYDAAGAKVRATVNFGFCDGHAQGCDTGMYYACGSVPDGGQYWDYN